MSRYPGRILSSTAPTVSANSAKGIWTLEEAMQYVKAGQWPVPTGNGDPYFQYNTMLLPGQGTNGAQNNTFLDSSTNNFTITRNGNTTQGTFTPFSGTEGNWSNYLGTGGVSNTSNTVGSFGTSDFTVEAFVYWPAAASSNETYLEVSTGTRIIFGRSSTGYRLFWNGTEKGFTYNFAIGVWNHIAVTRQSGTVYCYINGVSAMTPFADTTNFTSTRFDIGRNNDALEGMNGFVSNLRVTKNAALYTSTFTPPTSPLTTTVSSGTVALLTCQSNRFIDNSASALALTTGGTVSVTPFQPFGAPTVAYSASTIGGSGYFDGTGDFLSWLSGSSVAFGSGDFTVETWFYTSSISGSPYFVDARDASNTGTWAFHINNSTSIIWFNGSSAWTVSATFPLNQWNHIAYVRSGTTGALYLNGSRVSTQTDSTNYSVTPTTSYVGARYTNVDNFLGYLSGTRIVKGTAVYSGTTYTIPTAPLTAITNTTFLANYTNAGIIDNAQKNNLETVGNAQISTTQYKWGASSMYFDGTGDYLIPSSSTTNLQAFGTGDFTIEFWFYSNNSGSQQMLYDSRPASTNGNYITLYKSSSNVLELYVNSATRITGTATIAANTWYHVALSRTGGGTKLYVNGNQTGSTYADTTNYLNASNRPVIASDGATLGNIPLNGYIQDLRITKGYARYPYNFTAPTAALPLFWQAAATPSSDPYFDYTTLLLPGNGTNGAQNNTFLDSSTNAFTITRNGNTTQGTFTPFSQTGWSNYFDGTGDYLVSSSTTAFNSFITGSASGITFTMEAWVYPTTTVAGGGGAWQGAPIFVKGATYLNFQVYNNKLRFYWYDGSAQYVDSGASVPLNTWTYVAVTVNGSSITLYVNGVASGTGTFTGISTLGLGGSEQIGYQAASGNTSTYYGYISNLRVSNNIRTISLPTSALTSDANTIYLTCQNNRFVDNSASPKTFTVNGDTSVQAFSPFNPTAAYSTSTVGGSGYFDGTGDYLSVSNNALIATGDFTMEAWCYTTRNNAYQGIISSGDSSNTAGARIVQGNTGNVEFWVNGQANTSTALPINQWNHVAIVRSGSGSNNISCYLNGTRLGQLTQTSSTTNNTVVVGRYYNNGTDQYHWLGYIADARFVVGSAVYSGATYTVPTAPLTAVTNTQLLLSGTNGGIIDNTAKNNLETVGGASISTTVSKFGGSSMYFDGTGDWLDILAANQLSNFSSGDWTIEAWIYRSTASANHCLLNFINSAGANAGLTLQVNSSNQLVTDNGTAGALAAGTVPSNQWVHIAIARYSGTTTGYINGVAVGTTTQAPSASQYLRIGALGNGAYTYHGYINDLRVTKGIARYTQNFTPPTTAFLTL